MVDRIGAMCMHAMVYPNNVMRKNYFLDRQELTGDGATEQIATIRPSDDNERWLVYIIGANNIDDAAAPIMYPYITDGTYRCGIMNGMTAAVGTTKASTQSFYQTPNFPIPVTRNRWIEIAFGPVAPFIQNTKKREVTYVYSKLPDLGA